MLEITIGLQEGYDDTEQRFVRFGGVPVQLEHSLLTLSKWEERWEKSFLSDDKTDEMMFDYIKTMLLPGDYSPDVLNLLTQSDVEAINKYINASKSATLLPTEPSRPGEQKKRITSEQIYGWMTALQIDWRSESWHLNRLFTLIRLCNIQNSQSSNSGKPKRITDRNALASRAELNARRRAEMGTTG